jgi:hypothetical protein
MVGDSVEAGELVHQAAGNAHVLVLGSLAEASELHAIDLPAPQRLPGDSEGGFDRGR